MGVNGEHGRRHIGVDLSHPSRLAIPSPEPRAAGTGTVSWMRPVPRGGRGSPPAANHRESPALSSADHSAAAAPTDPLAADGHPGGGRPGGGVRGGGRTGGRTPRAAWWGKPIVGIAGVLIGANALAGVATFVFLQYVISPPVGLRTPRHASGVITVTFVIYLSGAIPAGAAINARVFRPVARWLHDGRSPSPDEQWATLLQPVRQAGAAFGFWMVAAVLFGVLTGVEGYPARRVAIYVVGILLGALASCSLSVLLIERVLRPVVIVALDGDIPGRAYGVGVRPRLLLAWAFGSGVPIVGLLLTAFERPSPTSGNLRLPVVFLCVAALATGFSLIFTAARSIADPLGAVRDALERVERGDLSGELDVDDGGEVGQLEAGVNRMVVGLRQRRTLEDLFGRYVGEAVAERALERGHDLGGERRRASVLFVDLVGSTRMAATLPPEEVVRVLNSYFQAVVATVGDEGGWVNKFEGDGAMCVFGPPGASDGHAERALRAARRLQTLLALTGGEFDTPHRLDAAIGVSGGDVVAGHIGSPDRFEFTVIGDPVNEAARLTELAKTGRSRLLASEVVVLDAAPAEASRWRPVGSVVLRGRSTATVVYEPVDPDS